MKKRVNQSIIAKKIGISQRAVSKALNGEKDISEKTRLKVFEIAEKMRYRPNRLARSLIEGKSKIIGVVMPRAQGLYFYSLWQEIEDEIFKAGYTPLMLRGGYDEKTDEAIFQLILQYQAEGLIVIPRSKNWRKDFFEDYQKDHGNVVFIGQTNIQSACCVYNDDYSGTRLAVNYLVGLGHRKIAYVGPADRKMYYNRMRYDGYVDELTNQGIKINRRYFIDFDLRDDMNLLIENLRSLPEITAVLCQSDKIALNVFHACQAIDLSIPEDVSIMGYANNLHYPEELCIQLSTIGHKPELVGRTAVARILALINGEKVNRNSPMENELIVRKSTAKPRK